MVALVLSLAACASQTPTPTPPASSDPAEVPWPAAGLIEPSAHLVFQWGTQRDAIYTQLANGDERTPALEVSDSTLHPDFSPDGSHVTFKVEGSKDQIWIAKADGSEASVLVPCAEETCFGTDFPAWSPDGSAIVFTSYNPPPDDNSPPAGSTLQVIDVTSLEVRVVVSSAPGEILDNARWSPDGSSIVFQIDHFDSSGNETALFIATASLADGAVSRLTAGDMFGSYPDWNRIDGRIAFVTFDLGAFESLPAGAASNLYTIAPDGSGLAQLTDLPANGARVTQPTWTLNGAGVLVTAVSEDGLRTPAVVPGSGGTAIPLGVSPATHVREFAAPQ